MVGCQSLFVSCNLQAEGSGKKRSGLANNKSSQQKLHLLSESQNLVREECSNCAHLCAQLTASEKRCGRLAQELDELRVLA